MAGKSGGIRIATETFEQTDDPDTIDRLVSKQEIDHMYRHFIKDFFPGLGPTCIKASNCMYTVTPDFGFVIDTLPKTPNVIIASPCSGHGFKHSAAIGELVCKMVMGDRGVDVRGFGLGRLEN